MAPLDARRQAGAGTEEIVATLERVLARSPQHPGANHYYIHAVEASQQPETRPCPRRSGSPA